MSNSVSDTVKLARLTFLSTLNPLSANATTQ
jgi:hypothetical protein